MSPETPGIIAAAAGATVNHEVQQSGIDIAARRADLNKHGLADFADNADDFVRENMTEPGEVKPTTSPDPTPTSLESSNRFPTGESEPQPLQKITARIQNAMNTFFI